MASNVAQRLHSVPHYDFHFQSAPNTLDLDDREYQEALAQIAFPLAVFAVFVVLLKLCCCCCYRSRYSGFKPYSETSSRRLVHLFLLLCAGAAGVCIYSTLQLKSGVNSFTDRTTATVALLDTLVGECNTNANQAVQDAQSVSQMKVSAADEGAKAAVVECFTGLAVKLSAAASDIGGSIRIDKWNGDIHHYDQMRYIIALVLSSLLAAFCLCVMMALCCRSHGATRCLMALVVAAFFVCCVVGSVLLSASVALGDFCVDPDTAVTSTLSDANANYYITCGVFPYESYFTAANNLIANARSDAATLDRDYRGDISQLLNNFSTSINAIHAQLLCNGDGGSDGGLHQQYEGAVDAVCTDGLESVFQTTVALVFAGLCFLVVMCVSRSLVYHLHPDNNYTPIGGFGGYYNPPKPTPVNYANDESDPLLGYQPRQQQYQPQPSRPPQQQRGGVGIVIVARATPPPPPPPRVVGVALVRIV